MRDKARREAELASCAAKTARAELEVRMGRAELEALQERAAVKRAAGGAGAQGHVRATPPQVSAGGGTSKSSADLVKEVEKQLQGRQALLEQLAGTGNDGPKAVQMRGELAQKISELKGQLKSHLQARERELREQAGADTTNGIPVQNDIAGENP